MNSDPNKHHFLPVFYLKRWVGSDGRLTQFSRPYRDVKPLRRHPEAIGYVKKLYAVEGLPDELANAMEREFLSPVDSRAAEALDSMLSTGGADNLTNSQRLSWSQFIASLMTRMPADINRLRGALSTSMEMFIPIFQDLYNVVREADWPATAFEFLDQELKEVVSQKSVEFVKDVISHPQFSGKLNFLEWRIRFLERSRNTLLTSDRPITFTHSVDGSSPYIQLEGALSHLVVPIGPRALFLAAHPDAMLKLKEVPDDDMAKALNAFVVGNATSYVYGDSDNQLRFVQNRFGTSRELTIMDLTIPLVENLRGELKGFKLPLNLTAMAEFVNDVRRGVVSRSEIKSRLERTLLPTPPAINS